MEPGEAGGIRGTSRIDERASPWDSEASSLCSSPVTPTTSLSGSASFNYPHGCESLLDLDTHLPSPNLSALGTMSFSILPPELQEAIVVGTDRATLARLCLASKSMLALARPQLYSTLEIELALWGAFELHYEPPQSQSQQEEVAIQQEEGGSHEENTSDDPSDAANEDDEDDELRQYLLDQLKKVRLYLLVEARPEYATFVKHLSVYCGSSSGVATPKFARFFSSLSRLEHLTIMGESGTFGRGHEGGEKKITSFLASSCPSTVTSLDLALSYMPASAILGMLSRVPLLETLYLGQDNTEGSFPSSPRTNLDLPRLQCLHLSYPFRSCSFFSILSKSTISLTSLHSHLACVQALIGGQLSEVRNLFIWGDQDFPGSQDLPSHLAAVLEGCPSLKTLRLAIFHDVIGSTDSNELEGLQVLTHLPPTLDFLELVGVEFPPTYLVEHLNSGAPFPHTLQLSRFESGLFPVVYDRAGEDKVEEACRNRNISVYWRGGRPVEDPKDTLTMAELIAMMANFAE